MRTAFCCLFVARPPVVVWSYGGLGGWSHHFFSVRHFLSPLQSPCPFLWRGLLCVHQKSDLRSSVCWHLRVVFPHRDVEAHAPPAVSSLGDVKTLSYTAKWRQDALSRGACVLEKMREGQRILVTFVAFFFFVRCQKIPSRQYLQFPMDHSSDTKKITKRYTNHRGGANVTPKQHRDGVASPRQTGAVEGGRTHGRKTGALGRSSRFRRCANLKSSWCPHIEVGRWQLPRRIWLPI